MNITPVPLADHDGLIVESESPLPTRYGTFTVSVFRFRDDPTREHVAIVSGDVSGAEDVPVRLHSECLTSEVLGSLKCDCNCASAELARMTCVEPISVTVPHRNNLRAVTKWFYMSNAYFMCGLYGGRRSSPSANSLLKRRNSILPDVVTAHGPCCSPGSGGD